MGPLCALALCCSSTLALPQDAGEARDGPHRGPFGLSLVSTPTREPVAIGDFFLSSDCALCHPRQWKELKGSLHSVSHLDPLYRRFAELARREAGEDVYAYCSGCHSPAGVVTGLIPAVAERDLPEEARAGVTCDVCHQITALTGEEGPWGEPGNASFVLDPGRVKRGPYDDIERNPAHAGEKTDLVARAELCASCHTVIHPVNGLRIEHTYDEWKRSVYAEKGIVCQDCHMRPIEDAKRVAATLEPTAVRGTLARKGSERRIAPHFFVGGNVEADRLAEGPGQARLAEARLQTAATVDLRAPEEAGPGEELAFDVVVTNVGAGHDLPTSLTELREMWLHVTVRAGDELLLERGALDEQGEIPPGTARFGTALVDADGNETWRPWEAAAFAWRRTIPPKGSDAERYTMRVPASLDTALTIDAELLYRIAAPHIVAEVMGEDAFVPRTVQMAAATRHVQPGR